MRGSSNSWLPTSVKSGLQAGCGIYRAPSKLLDSQTDDDDDEIEVTGLAGRMLADGLILVHWDSAHKGRRARRTSLWRRDEDGWRQVHHQGTILHD